MEGATTSKASAAMAGEGEGASVHLKDLPSRGLFSSTVLSSNPGGMRVYLCERDTAPPADQFIKTNQTNILIRALTNNKQKNDGGSRAAGKGKRSAERTLDGNSSKKATMSNGSGSVRQEGSSSRKTDEFHGLTVERLRALLREKGLLTKGKKDELIARLKANRDMVARLKNDREGEAK